MDSRFESLISSIDHALLQPVLTDKELEQGCAFLRERRIFSVCIKPYAVRDAVRWLKGSEVKTGTVVGFPHGSSSIDVKVLESRQACLDGAVEIDMVVNIGKVKTGDWAYVRDELAAVNQEVIGHGGLMKVIFETDFLDENEKIRLCEVCSDVRVAFVKTSTGFGFLKDDQGGHRTGGATVADIKLMRQHSAPWVQIKASGGIRSLNDLLALRDAGATRFGTGSTANILSEAAIAWNIQTPAITEIPKQDQGY